ncbi:hypothetical protein [Streptomyces litchfieldiae]
MARTVTSTVRVLETLPALLRGDSRVAVVFAHDPSSAFSDGVLDLLRHAGCRVMPWSQLRAFRPDLILSASENVNVPEATCPVLVLPHGVGFQKFVPRGAEQGTRLSGVVPEALLASGRAWLAVSHPDQETQLLRTHPEAVGRTLLVGDPCFDELSRSLGNASTYRRALGVAEGQRLVVLSSTWGPTSLLGRYPDLPARVLAALPCDEYRVAAIVHPNVWSAHGAWQIRVIQAAALDAGLLLMPTVHAWRSALVAADAVVGDHGSVTLYGAALGKPVLLAAFGHDAVPGTAIDRLGQVAPRLSPGPGKDIRRQIEATLWNHTADHYAEISAAAFAEPGRAIAQLRAVVYRLLELAEPEVAAPGLKLPRPDPPAAAVTSWMVATSLSVESGHSVVGVRRHPAAVSGHEHGQDGHGPDGDYLHLACVDEERDRPRAESASVILRGCPAATVVAARAWIRDTLNRLPGSLMAATAVTGGGYLMGVRDGRVVEVTVTGRAVDAGLPAAVVYTLLRAGSPLVTDDFVTLRVGSGREEHVTLRVLASLSS